MKREMWGRKGEPSFYCRPDPSHSRGFGFPPYFPVFDFIIIIILSISVFLCKMASSFLRVFLLAFLQAIQVPTIRKRFLMPCQCLVYPIELLLKEEQKLAIRAVFDGKDMFVPLLSRDLRKEDLASSFKLVMFAVAFSKETILLLQA